MQPNGHDPAAGRAARAETFDKNTNVLTHRYPSDTGQVGPTISWWGRRYGA
jgi:hypothetical protein